MQIKQVYIERIQMMTTLKKQTLKIISSIWEKCVMRRLMD